MHEDVSVGHGQIVVEEVRVSDGYDSKRHDQTRSTWSAMYRTTLAGVFGLGTSASWRR